MQAIHTKTLPATDTKGTRIKATTASGISLTESWDYGEDGLNNARRIVSNLIHMKLNDGWYGTYHAAATADGYVFVRNNNPTVTV